jgi:DNA-binding response OmpR family regulator
MARILCIDSDQPVVTAMSSLLTTWGYEIQVAGSGENGYQLARALTFDAAIVDQNLEGPISGVELCCRLRERCSNLGIIFLLSARENIEEKLNAYYMGVDDCMVKMPPNAEFRARLAALIRRSSMRADKKVVYGSIELEPIERTATVQGSPIDLTPTQFRILDYILRNVGRIVAPNEFKLSVFRSEEAIDSSKLRVHIYDLRRRLGSVGYVIESVRGKGYGVGLSDVSTDHSHTEQMDSQVADLEGA